MARANKLGEYRKKRNPADTSEPFSPEPLPVSHATKQGAFVVHLHAARRRHYDLRLEVGGVLKSFAVPKGPSLNTNDKHLAVQTEDHPVEYLDFESVIPEGNYGAGSMIAWDMGRAIYLERSAEEGLETGKLDFELRGFKLRGRFALVRMKPRGPQKPNDKPQWLLLKKHDAYASDTRDVIADAPQSVLSGLAVEELARSKEIAREISSMAKKAGATEGELNVRRMTPMLCASDTVPLEKKGWCYELKLDGVRILAQRRGDEVTLVYRTGHPATESYPEITRSIRAHALDRFILDGEIVTFDEYGKPNFQRLGRRIHARRPHDIRAATKSVPVVYLVFDVLEVGPYDLRAVPLKQRKKILSAVVRGQGWTRAVDYVENDGRVMFEFSEAQKLEGLVAKRLDSPYQLGPKRSGDWLKLKSTREDDFVVVGWTQGEGSRSTLGAVDIASYDDGHLVVRGKVGSGFEPKSVEAMLSLLEPLRIKHSAAKGEFEPAKRGRTFVKPEIVVNVRYGGWTEEHRLRFPVFKGIRADVAPTDCRAAPHDEASLLRSASEQKGASQNTSEASDEPTDTKKENAKKSHSPRTQKAKKAVTLTNQKKVFWPDEGYTKGDLCTYYETIAPTLLPYLENRPVMLVRYPDGIEGKNFYQWNIPSGTPTWIRTLQVTRDREGRDEGSSVAAFLVDDVETLLYIINLGCIPIHVLAYQAQSRDQCDFLTIDFDVGESEFRHAITLARELHTILSDIGLPGFPKTSGQSGLHVLVPMGSHTSFETARTLADVLARILHARMPDISTVERHKAARGKRVYIDTGQTGPSRTIVSPYSVRAQRGATVSTPLTWDEVGFALDPRRYTMFTVPERVREHGDPSTDLLKSAPNIVTAVEKLGKLTKR